MFRRGPTSLPLYSPDAPKTHTHMCTDIDVDIDLDATIEIIDTKSLPLLIKLFYIP